MLKLIAFAVFLCSSSLAKGEVVTGHLAPTELFSVSWTADLANETAIFTVSAETTGYIGFGLSPNGGMAGADIVMGGVDVDGSTYFSDRHGTGTFEPILDESQDWALISAVENATHTTIVFERAFETGDSDDISITNGTTNFIWAIGAIEFPLYHIERGSAAINILNP